MAGGDERTDHVDTHDHEAVYVPHETWLRLPGTEVEVLHHQGVNIALCYRTARPALSRPHPDDTPVSRR